MKVYDLAGNVWEWVEDWWHEGAPGDGSAWTDGVHPTWRVLRGGSYLVRPRELRAAYRRSYLPGDVSIGFGFRVVWSSSGGQAD